MSDTVTPGSDTPRGKRARNKGFASMTPEQRQRIARLGGLAAHRKGTAHEWTSTEAAVAGKKGGSASRGGRGRLKTFDEAIEDEQSREHAAATRDLP